jgi:hypothetical protein
LKELNATFSNNTSEFFKTLKELLTPIDQTSSWKLKELIERNEKFYLSLKDLLFERDKDVKHQLLDCKIKICEKEILIYEKQMATESWQRRFNHYYKKYNDLKKVLEVPFEEDYLRNFENRSKLGMSTIKEENIQSTNNDVLSEFFENPSIPKRHDK